MIVADAITPDWGFQCGPTFSTTIVNLRNGREKRNAAWLHPKHKASAQFSSLEVDQFLYLKDLFLQSRGMTYAFLFRDWTDYEADDEKFGVGDGTTKTFQLSKTSSLPGGTPYTRIVRAPEAGVVIKSAGTVVASASVSQADGSVAFSAAPASGAQLTWTGRYYLVMRFDSDELMATVQQVFDNQGRPCMDGSVDLIESFEDAV